MPKAHPDVNGFSFSFYSNDHVPMHVHVKKGGEECVFLLGDVREEQNERGDVVFVVEEAPSLRENHGMNRLDVRRALTIIGENQAAMIVKWKQHLG